ncbi:chorismate-binding protein [Silvanigrella aquatica]|uniref:Chorismate-utilising enzyme C-terminal domain-containing protein n=1 Tax=Silvanigrella aquatica TaxID=1915309 RepID=A0A1L4CXV7_9BACT|nr:chorismate-binding protein [Silvanigrella aquatica]APJ02793.1 hypothetical protein AXG55_02175 [Silvanigrella aquatica]
MKNYENIINLSDKLKTQLQNYSQNIQNIIQFLEDHFQNKFLMHFQIHNCEGYEYPINNNFNATNIYPNNLINIYDKAGDCISLRFFCNINIIYSKKNHVEFCNQLKKKNNSPLFFMTPYLDSYNEELSYIIEPKFEIKAKITKDNVILQFINYHEKESFFNSYIEKIKFLFHNPLTISTHKKSKSSFAFKIPKNIVNIIDKVKKNLNKGDCYLVNITTTETVSRENKFISSQDFFNSWIHIFSRFGIYFKDQTNALASFSPERFICMSQGVIATEPIKGTLKSKESKPKLVDAHKIWSIEKEIYEHTLVVDLMRNDLYEVCMPESVTVFRPFYARISGSLIQMQSFILGKLKKEENLATCLEKMLPAGSITGTPKKRVCEIIAHLEQNTRGYYTGVCGILEVNGDFDSTILIRSVYLGERGLYFGVGAGITTLSETQLEFEEFEIKLSSFLPVLEEILS